MSLGLILPNRVKVVLAHLHRYVFVYLVGVVLLTTGLISLSLNSNETKASSGAEMDQKMREIIALRQKVEVFSRDVARLDRELQRKKQNETPTVARRDQAPKVSGFQASGGFREVKFNGERPYIPLGSVFKAKLLTSIKTSLRESFVMAVTTREFQMDRRRSLPKGSKIVGTAQLDPLLKGVVVRFHTVVTPKGKEHGVNLLALSDKAFPELDGIFFSNALETYGSAMAFGFLSGFSDAAVDRQPTVLGSKVTPSLTNRALSGLSVASFQVAEDLLEEVKGAALEYVVVPAGTDIYVVLERRLEIPKGGLK